MRISQAFPTSRSQRARCLDHILDLSSINGAFCEVMKLRARYAQAGIRVDGLLRLDLVEECDPYCLARVGLEVVVSQGDVNPRLESLVKGFDAVRCQEEDALEIS